MMRLRPESPRTVTARAVDARHRNPTGWLPGGILLALILALLATPALAQEQRDFSRSFDARAGTTLELENLAGRVVVEGSSGGQLEVSGTVYAENGSLLDRIQVRFEERGDRIVARAQYPVDDHDEFRYGGGRPGYRGRTRVGYQGERVTVYSGGDDGVLAWVDFRVRLPAGIAGEIENHVGDVEATGVEGDLSLDTGAGNISVSDGVGALLADTGSGHVSVENQTGDVVADTGSGDVEARRIRGNLNADTGSGNIVVMDVQAEEIVADTGSGGVTLERVSGAVEADTGSGTIDIRDLEAGARVIADTGSGSVRIEGDLSRAREVRVDTGSGSVRIELTEAFPMTLDLSSGSGGVDVDLPDLRVTESGRNSFRGEVSGGGTEVVVSTGSGSVRVRLR